MALVCGETVGLGMRLRARANRGEKLRHRTEPLPEVQVIPAPTIFWHPSISLEKLIADLAEYQDSVIVS
jgi:hypothetical protein